MTKVYDQYFSQPLGAIKTFWLHCQGGISSSSLNCVNCLKMWSYSFNTEESGELQSGQPSQGDINR